MSYNPDYKTSPGEIFAEWLDFKRTTPSDFAGKYKIPRKSVVEILEGKQKITNEIANVLSDFSGRSSQFWLNLEKNFSGNQGAGIDE